MAAKCPVPVTDTFQIAVHGVDLIGAACARVDDGDGAAREPAAQHRGRCRLGQGHPKGATGSDVDARANTPAERGVDDLGVPGAKGTARRDSTKRPVVEVADTSLPEMLNL